MPKSENMIDIRAEVDKLHVEAKKLLRHLLNSYVTRGLYDFNKSLEISPEEDNDKVGMKNPIVRVAFDQLVASGFADSDPSRPDSIRMNRTRLDTLRSMGKI